MGTTLELSFPGTPMGVRMLRQEISALASDCGMDSETLADVRLAVTEAATNAVVHAYEKSRGYLSVKAGLGQGQLSIVIADTGPGVTPGHESKGAGVGLALIASLASQFKLRSRPTGTEVHMAFPCPQAS